MSHIINISETGRWMGYAFLCARFIQALEDSEDGLRCTPVGKQNMLGFFQQVTLMAYAFQRGEYSFEGCHPQALRLYLFARKTLAENDEECLLARDASYPEAIAFFERVLNLLHLMLRRIPLESEDTKFLQKVLSTFYHAFSTQYDLQSWRDMSPFDD